MKVSSTRAATANWILASVAAMGWMASSVNAQDLAVTHVTPSAKVLGGKDHEVLTVRFTLTATADAKLLIYDGRDLLIREISAPSSLAAGEHSLRWDLRDRAGRRVPPEAYVYVIEARTANGNVVRYDLSEATGGETVATRDVKWDAQSRKLSYVLDRPARVNIRLGLNEGGPLLRTLLDWVVRPGGFQEERWDGMDASGVLNLAAHPKLAIGVQAFALPENSVLIGEPQPTVKLLDDLPSDTLKRPRTSAPRKRMYAHAQQALEDRGDIKVHLTLPAGLPRSSSGLPTITTRTPVRLEVDPQDRDRALSRRFEPVFFVDGQFAFENEVGFVPMTWNFDPADVNEGEHYLTVNLRGYEGNFGVATVKVLVLRGATSALTPR